MTLAVPAAQRTTARGATPTNEYAAQVAPPTTDSSKKLCSPAPSAAYADTGVSESASSSRYTGIKFPRVAAAANSVREGVYTVALYIALASSRDLTSFERVQFSS
jgi:hypothetical protein